MSISPKQQLAIEQRRERVTRLYLQNTPAYEIARIEKVAPKTVYEDIKVSTKRSHLHSIGSIDDRRSLMVACLDEILRELWLSWHRSKEDEVSETVTTGEATKTTRRGQSGSAAIMAQIIVAWSKKCELLGLTGKHAIEEAEQAFRPMVGLIINSREELEMLKNLRSMTVEQAQPYLPKIGQPTNGHNGHQNGDDEDAD